MIEKCITISSPNRCFWGHITEEIHKTTVYCSSRCSNRIYYLGHQMHTTLVPMLPFFLRSAVQVDFYRLSLILSLHDNDQKDLVQTTFLPRTGTTMGIGCVN